MPELIPLSFGAGGSGGPVTSANITDASAPGKAVLTGNADAGRAAIGAAAAAELDTLEGRVTAAETSLADIPNPPTWDDLDLKPEVVAAGATKAAARDAIDTVSAEEVDASVQSQVTALADTIPETARDIIGATLLPGAGVTITPDDAANTITIAASGGGGSSEVLVWRYTAGAYPTLPATAPAGVKLVHALGPSQPGSVPSWVGVGAGKIPALYEYAPLA